MEPKRTRSEIKRQAILDAAKEAFQVHGVQGTSMDMLSSMANVSKRTVYNHFASKEALFSALIGDLWQQAKQANGFKYQPDQPLQKQLSALLEAEISVICSEEHISLNRVAFGHFFFHPEELQKEVEKLNVDETALISWLRAAKQDKRLIELEEQLASQQLHNLIKGECFWPQLLQIAPILDAQARAGLAERTAAMFLSHYQV